MCGFLAGSHVAAWEPEQYHPLSLIFTLTNLLEPNYISCFDIFQALFHHIPLFRTVHD
jgi:hypothetical protein